MNYIKALEDLRELAADINASEIVDHMELYPSCVFDGAWLDAWQADFYRTIDDLEAEVSERFVELPVDADGMPIHVGDCLQLGDTRGEVVALTYCPANGKLPWDWQCDTGDWYNTAFAYHVKPRTLEDVLRDLVNDTARQGHQIGLTAQEIVERYADEIRELMGGAE